MPDADMLYAESLFRRTGAVLDGHFLLTSGLHSPVYWEKFRILEQPEYTQKLCAMIAERFKAESDGCGGRANHRRHHTGVRSG